MMEKLTKAMSATPEIAKFIQEMIRRSRLHVGQFARRARNVLARANGNEPEPGCGPGRGVKRWARYHKRVVATLPEKPHYHSIGKQPQQAA